MIKVPATPAGLDALEELAAAGVTLNVTLIFTMRQYEAARDAIWRGAQRRKSLDRFKSVYSIFVSRVDVYTEKHVPELSPAAQGQVGIVGVEANLARESGVLGDSSRRRCSRRSSSPAPARRSRKIRRGSMSRRSPAATSKPIRRPRTTPSKPAASRSGARSTNCRRRRARRDRRQGRCAEAGRHADARRRRQVRRPAESRCSSCCATNASRLQLEAER